MILVGPDKGNRLVKKYRDPKKLLAAIPHSDRLPRLPRTPFIGELSFLDIIAVLAKQPRPGFRIKHLDANRIFMRLFPCNESPRVQESGRCYG